MLFTSSLDDPETEPLHGKGKKGERPWEELSGPCCQIACMRKDVCHDYQDHVSRPSRPFRYRPVWRDTFLLSATSLAFSFSCFVVHSTCFRAEQWLEKTPPIVASQQRRCNCIIGKMKIKRKLHLQYFSLLLLHYSCTGRLASWNCSVHPCRLGLCWLFIPFLRHNPRLLYWKVADDHGAAPCERCRWNASFPAVILIRLPPL